MAVIIGLPLRDFYDLSPDEFGVIADKLLEERDLRERTQWEQIRVLSCISISPHVSKKLNPKKILPLPWDDEDRRRRAAEAPKMDRDEQMALLASLAEENGLTTQ